MMRWRHEAGRHSMRVTFLDMEHDDNELNGSVICDSERLREILYCLADEVPFACKLTGENGYCLDIGIGEVGFLQFNRSEGDLPYLMAVAPEIVALNEYVEFYLGDQPAAIHRRFCLPFEDAVKIAIYFLEMGTACPFISWEVI